MSGEGNANSFNQNNRSGGYDSNLGQADNIAQFYYAQLASVNAGNKNQLNNQSYSPSLQHIGPYQTPQYQSQTSLQQQFSQQ